MLAPKLERPSRELKAREKVVSLQVWELRQEIVNGVTGRQVFQERLDWIPHPTYHRLAVTDLEIDGDAWEGRQSSRSGDRGAGFALWRQPVT